MAKTFKILTRSAMRKLIPGKKINEHGITFERLINGDDSYTIESADDILGIGYEE